MKWLDLETEIRGYIIIFGMVFLIAVLSGCGKTVQGVGKDIIDMGQSVVDFGKEDKKSA